MNSEQLQRLARWRRKGNGVWKLTLIIEGYDEVFTVLYPGDKRELWVKGIARWELAQLYEEKFRHVHVTRVEKEG